MIISPECLKAMLTQETNQRCIHCSRVVPEWLVSLMNNFGWSCNDKLFQVPENVLAWELAKTYQYLIDQGEEVVLRRLGRVRAGVISQYLTNCTVRTYYSNYKVSKDHDN